MRNPMNSWDKADSEFKGIAKATTLEDGIVMTRNVYFDALGIGPNDHKLMMQLSNAGTDHGKYLRYLEVYLDITAPLYWWKEFKTYRHGRKFMDDDDIFEYEYDDDILEYHIETNSCSTMHKIHEKEFTMDDFSHEHLIPANSDGSVDKDLIMSVKHADASSSYDLLGIIIWYLNYWRKKFIETKEKKYWWQMIQLLPNSYNQKRTVKLSYECLARMYHSRKNHKQDEWVEFCKWIESLPYSEVITGGTDK
jgi:hypothetical protein